MGNQNARTAGRTSSLGPADQRNDRWLTPMPIIDALTFEIGADNFDLDPCGAPGHRTADTRYLLESGNDGLRDPWDILAPEKTRVWMNPPYGKEMMKWVGRFLTYYRAGKITGTMLVPFDPGAVNLWQDRLWKESSAILAYRHRINFVSRDGEGRIGKGMVSVNDSAIVAFGKSDADALWEAVTLDLIPGALTYYTDGGPR